MRLTCLLCLVLVCCAPRKPLPRLGEVPEFELTTQQNRHIDRSALDGHVWIADFIYTNCPGPCPRMTSRMRAIQDATPLDVRFVSFTVDPETDTPAVLAAYAKKFSADESRWSFLTGDKATLNALDQEGFKLGSITAGMDHSTRFVLVDKRARIRGYYSIAEPDLIGRIAKDAARLQKESD